MTTTNEPRTGQKTAPVCDHNLVANYRQARGGFSCTRILFNHASPLRPERFVMQKVIKAAREIALGRWKEKLMHFGLGWRGPVAQDHALYRPSDLARVAGEPARAARVLGWQARTDVDEVIDLMCRARASRDKNKGADR